MFQLIFYSLFVFILYESKNFEFNFKDEWRYELSNTKHLIQKYGYECERHQVKTADGYILRLYRIPHGKKCGPCSQPKTPVLVQHGMFGSSADFVIADPQDGLGFILADNCYDVWLGNNRGNKESRFHEKLNPDDDLLEFWNFSWHEMGEFDVPAFIDYILTTTGTKDLFYIGYSQGTTQFFVYGSLYPEHSGKVKGMFAVAPAIRLENCNNIIVRLISYHLDNLEEIAGLLAIYEILPADNIFSSLWRKISHQSIYYTWMLNILLLLISKKFYPTLDESVLMIISEYAPAGSSLKQLLHYGQLVGHDKGFSMYDYGEEGNIEAYGQTTPPSYNVSSIRSRIYLYYGDADDLINEEDVFELVKRLPNLGGLFKVQFNHVEFLYSKNLRKLLYKKILRHMNGFQ